jgi:hypothetical protein
VPLQGRVLRVEIMCRPTLLPLDLLVDVVNNLDTSMWDTYINMEWDPQRHVGSSATTNKTTSMPRPWT